MSDFQDDAFPQPPFRVVKTVYPIKVTACIVDRRGEAFLWTDHRIIDRVCAQMNMCSSNAVEAASWLAVEIANAVGFDPLVRLDAKGTTVADVISRHLQPVGEQSVKVAADEIVELLKPGHSTRAKKVYVETVAAVISKTLRQQ